MSGHDAPVHYFDRVDSTQDIAHRLAAEGAVAGTAVVAVQQVAGRGSRGRVWFSGRGGLWLSVIWRPREASGAEALSVRAALALAAALEGAGAPGLAIKWPNDLMRGDRKVGGILCEARWSGDQLGWVVAGAGVNVQNEIPPALAGTAAALDDAGTLRAGDLIQPAIAALRRAGSRTGALDAAERAAFARRDWLAGRTLAAPVRGTADGLAPDGALRILSARGEITLHRAGSVVPDAPSFNG
ncbi:MAG TPA: biotin--[acetyl-CoA-carboxylase] ligase [Gemmatimonadales bacterium]|nr:biotin--[acetyl-CoA-carboxylase] ligase [Gemmatimonadales bacterium]